MNQLTNQIAKGFFAIAALGAALASTSASAGDFIYQPRAETRIVYDPVYVRTCVWVNFGSHVSRVCQ